MCIGLVISLVVKGTYFKEINREHQYTQMLYNRLIQDVDVADGGGVTFPGYQKSSVNMTYAAGVLQDLYLQANIVNHERGTQQIQEDASFVSYVAMALVGKNMKYLVGPKHKAVVTITPKQAENLVRKIYQIIIKNQVNGDIPSDKIATVYNELNNLIPENLKSIDGVLTYLYQ